MTVQLGWLRTFVMVYRLGSFTKAAQKLGLSQPAVTHQVRSLEKAVGRPLFDRLPDGARPTAAAESLVLEVSRPIDQLSAAVERYFSEHTADRILQVGGPVELLTTRVIPAISDLTAEGCRFRFVFGLAGGLLDQLEEGELDLVVSTVRPRRRGIAVTPLADEEFVLVASPQIAGEIGNGVAERGPAALQGYPVISYAESLPIVKRYWRMVFGSAPPVGPVMVVPDLRGVLAAVRSAGNSVLPTYLCVDELASGDVVPLLQPEEPPINTFYLAVRQGTLSRTDLALAHGQLLLKAQLWT